MTTTITVHSHNYPVLVTQYDIAADGQRTKFSESILEAEDGPSSGFYSTTSRVIEVVDLDYYDARVLKHRTERGRKYVAPATVATPSASAEASS